MRRLALHVVPVLVRAARATRAAALLAAVALLAPRAAVAHEVLRDVEWNRAVAVHAYFPSGEPLAYAQYEIYAPADPRIPHQKGRTDREGWLAFVPSAAGGWRVKVVDDTGHGFDAIVDAGPGVEPARATRGPSTVAFVLRPLVGVAAVLLVFAAVLAVYRRQGDAP